MEQVTQPFAELAGDQDPFGWGRAPLQALLEGLRVGLTYSVRDFDEQFAVRDALERFAVSLVGNPKPD